VTPLTSEDTPESGVTREIERLERDDHVFLDAADRISQ
jgi:hypothetical protein